MAPQILISYPQATKDALANREPLTDDQKKEKRQIDVFNDGLRKVVASLSKDDRGIGIARFVVIATMSLATLVGAGVVLAGLLVPGENLVATITGGGIFLIGILIAAVVNPLQTVERDFVFRRWSDLIVSSYLIQFSQDIGPSEVARVASRSSSMFAVLAKAYATATSKNVAALTKVAGLLAPAEDEDDSADQALTVTNPGAQESAKGTPLAKPLVIVATGGEKLEFADNKTLPKGLTVDAKGSISGTPLEAKESNVSITVTDPAAKTSAAVSFVWVIK